MDSELRARERAALNDPYDYARVLRMRERAGITSYQLVVYSEVLNARCWLLSYMINGALEMIGEQPGVEMHEVMMNPYISRLVLARLTIGIAHRNELRLAFSAAQGRLRYRDIADQMACEIISVVAASLNKLLIQMQP